mgnify:FL=1
MSIKDQLLNKKLLKKWWFWVIVIILVATASVASGGKSKTDNDSNQTQSTVTSTATQQEAVTYTITGETLGEYGKEVTLNKDSDMPDKNFLYKLPAGSYKVTTASEKIANFFIVKDEIGTEAGNSEYPEILNNVGEGYFLTTGDNDLNGKAKKDVIITLGADESIQIVGTQTLILVKQ